MTKGLSVFLAEDGIQARLQAEWYAPTPSKISLRSRSGVVHECRPAQLA